MRNMIRRRGAAGAELLKTAQRMVITGIHLYGIVAGLIDQLPVLVSEVTRSMFLGGNEAKRSGRI
jgi:hypothetical protein